MQPGEPRAVAAVQDDVQHDGADVRRQPHLGAAGHHRAEVPGPPAAGRLRDVRVSVLDFTCRNEPNTYSTLSHYFTLSLSGSFPLLGHSKRCLEQCAYGILFRAFL